MIRAPGDLPGPPPADGGAVVIVVPCFNEAARFRPQDFLDFEDRAGSVRFLFVDDGSTDATARLLEELARKDPERFEVLTLATNSGKGEAVRQGMLQALRGHPRYAGFWDADLATPLSTILDFCAVLDRTPRLEMVFGARVLLMGRSIRRRPARHYAGRVFATAVSVLLGLAIYDTQCGAKLFRMTPAIGALFIEPFRSRWIFDVEILARLVRDRRGPSGPPPEQVVYEYPLEAWRDVPGSKLAAPDFLQAAADLTRIYWAYLR